MRAIINNIMDAYQMEAEARSILLDSTQRALRRAKEKEKADAQDQRVGNLARNVAMDLNDLLTRFYFLKVRQVSNGEQMTDERERAVVEGAAFVKSSVRSLSSMLTHLRETATFEEEIDRQLRELEATVKSRIQKFDEILDGAKPSLTGRVIRVARNMAGGFSRLLRRI